MGVENLEEINVEEDGWSVGRDRLRCTEFDVPGNGTVNNVDNAKLGIVRMTDA